MKINSESWRETLFSIKKKKQKEKKQKKNKKQSTHLMRKKIIQKPTCPALVSF